MAKTKRKSRPARWADAADRAREAMDRINSAHAELTEAFEELSDIKSEYEDWRDGLPENLQGGTLADKLNQICEIEFDADQTVEDLEGVVNQAENADFPLGFGRD